MVRNVDDYVATGIGMAMNRKLLESAREKICSSHLVSESLFSLREFVNELERAFRMMPLMRKKNIAVSCFKKTSRNKQ